MPRPKKEKPNRSDGRYEVKATVGHKFDGSPIRKSFYSDISKEDAKRKAKDYLVMSEAKELAGIPQIDNSVTFEEWAKVWLEKYKYGTVDEQTYDDTYKRVVDSYLIPHFGKHRLTEITPVDIKLFLKDFAEKYADTSIKKVRGHLNAIFETAIENDKCTKNPVKNIPAVASKKESKEKRTYSEEDVAKILEFAESHRFGLYIRILLDLGLRAEELCGLQWGDIDFDKKTISIQRAVTPVKNRPNVHKPKTKSSCRTLPLSTKTFALLKTAKNESLKALNPKQKIDNQFIMCTLSGRPFMDASFTKNRYKPFFKDLQSKHPKIEYLTPHEMRHTCGTLLYAKTKDLYAVSKYLGHSSVEITASWYVHDSVDLLRSHLQIE